MRTYVVRVVGPAGRVTYLTDITGPYMEVGNVDDAVHFSSYLKAQEAAKAYQQHGYGLFVTDVICPEDPEWRP